MRYTGEVEERGLGDPRDRMQHGSLLSPEFMVRPGADVCSPNRPRREQRKISLVGFFGIMDQSDSARPGSMGGRAETDWLPSCGGQKK